MKQKNGKNKQSEIVDTETTMRVSKKGTAVLIKHNDTTFITSVELMEKLIKGTLKTKDEKEQKSIQLGIISEDGINNDVSIWITMKNKSLYFVPEENVVLITPVSNVEKLLSGEYQYTKFGRFK